MNRNVNHFLVILSAVFLFILACDNSNNGIASESSEEISDIDPKVVKMPKSTEYYDYNTTVYNCSPGKTDHSVTTSSLINTSVIFSSTAKGGGSVGVEIPHVIKADLEGAIEKGYQNIFEQSKKEEYKVSKEIPPWQGITIMIKYTKKVYESEISYKKGKKKYTVPYQFIINVPIPEEIRFKNVKCTGQPSSVQIDPAYKTLEVGDELQLKAELLDNENNRLAPEYHKQYEKGVNDEVLFIFTTDEIGDIYVYYR